MKRHSSTCCGRNGINVVTPESIVRSNEYNFLENPLDQKDFFLSAENKGGDFMDILMKTFHIAFNGKYLRLAVLEQNRL